MSKRVAVIGECMLELKGEAFGAMTLGYGGDTFNTAVYLKRCGAAAGIEVSYATALGDDGLSTGLLDRWHDQGIDTRLVQRLPGRMPGLYMIELDGAGERSFHYWRDTAAAKAYFDAPVSPLEAQAADFDALYLSGITLAILPPAGRERLYALMAAMRERGAQVIFDNNFRPRLWPDRSAARAAFDRAFSLATIALVTADDHQALTGLDTLEAALAHARSLPSPELLIKRGASPTLVRSAQAPERWTEAATEAVARVVDTTAAGDAFAGGYLARRLAGADATSAAIFGNRVAARVIQHPGAIIPIETMDDLR
ncbi:ketodeoxygluconokinase [Roseateles chitinivorans]|uniref:2-dehydro-3-deoxygluconokinase n=1 Tax=Roseateles chitinivorans TaxID=2917965 RepID=A0A2G9C7T8_9BURK|nr:sugar kinase [Roseateles chitinivorans]PIM52457.1 ketodeoxygluconokinase [Roseateles chitinivorans]